MSAERLRIGMTSPRLVAALWVFLAVVLCGFAVLLATQSWRFDWQLNVDQMPAATLAIGMAVAGLAYCALLPLIRRTATQPAALQRGLVALMLAAGLGMRLVLLFSEPAMEDDSNRYLWEGALTAHGLSPYAVSPLDARAAPADTVLGRLAREGEPLLARVNHPELASSYPPVAQAAFAIAYWIAPWNLLAWRLVSLAADGAAMILLLLLLREAGRPAIWSALYWWSPIVVKELVNSAHMDELAVALVLLALFLSARRRHAAAILAIGLAVGAKLWPALLAPLILRPLWPRPIPIVAALLALGGMTLLWLLPAMNGFDVHSGLAAYVQGWTTNSALSPALERLCGLLLGVFGLEAGGWAFARGLAALALLGWALRQALRPVDGAGDLMERAGLVTAALVLLSPAQFPWYLVWTIPFLAFAPLWGLLAATVTVPLYYLAFHLLARGSYQLFLDWIVWAIWIPVWALLALQAIAHRRRGEPSQ